MIGDLMKSFPYYILWKDFIFLWARRYRKWGVVPSGTFSCKFMKFFERQRYPQKYNLMLCWLPKGGLFTLIFSGKKRGKPHIKLFPHWFILLDHGCRNCGSYPLTPFLSEVIIMAYSIYDFLFYWSYLLQMEGFSCDRLANCDNKKRAKAFG